MTDDDSVNRRDVLHQILTAVDMLLLDFDGPVCSTFAGISTHNVCTELRRTLCDLGHELPIEISATEDPFVILRYASIIGKSEAEQIEAQLSNWETRAVDVAAPTRGVAELIATWHATSRTIAIVSNNSSHAIEHYLIKNDLKHYIPIVSARTSSKVDLLKPSPKFIEDALRHANSSACSAVMIGDSITDIEAANAAGCPSIGLANKPYKHTTLRKAGSNVIVDDICELVAIVKELSRRREC